MKNKSVIISLLLLIILITAGALANSFSISIPYKVKVRSMNIKLSEIAYISGEDGFKENVSSISLGQAPLPGYKRVIYREEVIYALKNRGYNLSKVRLDIPYQFTVIADYKRVSINRLIDVGKDYIYSSGSYSKEKLEVEVINPPQKLMVPHGNLKLEVGDFYQGDLIGTITMPIKLIVNDKLYKRIYLQYKVQVLQEVLVAKKNLERGQLISRDDFRIEEILVDTPNSQYISTNTNLDAKIMKIFLGAGRPLLSRMVEFPPLVERWEEVQIIARIGGVEVVTLGKARQSGHLGERIKVQNMHSKKIITAEIIAKNKVKVLIH
ncbi:flagellar basal body P-ring formation chaperone FlgA [Orenia marismortui]|uniref:Flagella basal body P-ring formation protein FlgA n=1 Tax=Orenia marismortui TaxID=46469 RepID=A0A4R8HQV0_9FIRM|nr:flagellar basal body P-ring formation chaperone FlgA [Orenia marismortui]TDX59183.1 flagella basal body P-ring formation protein FlgA [Orenia marismortui]